MKKNDRRLLEYLEEKIRLNYNDYFHWLSNHLNDDQLSIEMNHLHRYHQYLIVDPLLFFDLFRVIIDIDL